MSSRGARRGFYSSAVFKTGIVEKMQNLSLMWVTELNSAKLKGDKNSCRGNGDGALGLLFHTFPRMFNFSDVIGPLDLESEIRKPEPPIRILASVHSLA